MPTQIEVVDGFEWCGGQGRFGAGRLGSDNTHADVRYSVGGMFGALSFTLGFAFWWDGYNARALCDFVSPYFQRVPDGGCDAGADPPVQCVESLSQLDFGTLWVDTAGGLCYLGKSYAGGVYTPIPFTAQSESARMVARAWNWVELKMELAGAVLVAGGTDCGGTDADPGAYGLIAARINGSEVMRYRVRDGDTDKCVYSTCACFLCEQIPLGVGVIRPQANSYVNGGVDDLVFRSWDMTDGEDDWLDDAGTVFLAAAGAGSSAGWTPVGAATNWQAAATGDDATSYNRTNETGKRDSLALEASADTIPVLVAQPVVNARSIYKAGGGPPMKAFYRRDGIDYATATLAPGTEFGQVGGDAGIPTSGETLASLSAGEIGYTTE